MFRDSARVCGTWTSPGHRDSVEWWAPGAVRRGGGGQCPVGSELPFGGAENGTTMWMCLTQRPGHLKVIETVNCVMYVLPR